MSSGREQGLEERPEGEEVGQAPPPVMTGTDELPLFRGLEGEQRWEEDYHWHRYGWPLGWRGQGCAELMRLALFHGWR